MVDPSVAFLNHGCFGARLHDVFATQQAWRARFESAPVHVLERQRTKLVDEAKAALGRFVGMTPASFGFVTNATDGVNAVLRSLTLERGDEIVTTTHVYNAVRQTMRHLVDRAGASMKEVDVPCPCPGPDAVLEAITAGLGERTRLLIVDHVTSPTGLRFPLERIIAAARARGVDVLVDGAHAPGMLDLDVEALGAAYYAGNLHKWVCAPPGAAFLWVRPDRQAGVHPTVISHFLGEGLATEFDWQGTRDISPWLTVPAAIEAMGRLLGPGSWPRIRAHNTALATWVQTRLCAMWEVEPLSPVDGSMLGSIVAIALPEAVCRRFETPEELHDRLYDEHAIEAPVFEWGGRWIIRPSCQIYNVAEQYERLGEAVLALARDAG
jgi:isopenicillin-N epimerase